MKTYTYCQSCGMPLDEENLLGTEKDGLKSREYCKYCYQNGAFTQPDLTLDLMRSRLLELMKPLSKLDPQVNELLQRLPLLRRWRDDTPHPGL